MHSFKIAFLSVCPLAQVYSNRFEHIVSIRVRYVSGRNDYALILKLSTFFLNTFSYIMYVYRFKFSIKYVLYLQVSCYFYLTVNRKASIKI